MSRFIRAPQAPRNVKLRRCYDSLLYDIEERFRLKMNHIYRQTEINFALAESVGRDRFVGMTKEEFDHKMEKYENILDETKRRKKQRRMWEKWNKVS